MATTRNRYVNPASTGGDGTTNALSGSTAAYSSLNACLTAEYAASSDLTSADVVLKIHREGSGSDTTQCDFADYQFTTDSTRYVWIVVDQANRHAGVWSTSKPRMGTSLAPGAIIGLNCHVVIEGLQLETDVGLGSNPNLISLLNNGTSADVTVRECILRATSTSGTSTQGRAIGGSGSVARTLKAVNNLIYGGFDDGIGLSFIASGGKLVTYHNTIVGTSGSGIVSSSSGSGRVFVKNNRVDSAGTDFSFSGTTVTSAGNYSSDATSPEGAGNQSKTFTWLNAAGSDYHLASGDTFTGADLSADATFAVSTDVDGDTRSSFYAGFDELTAAATDNDPSETTATVPDVTVGSTRTITVQAKKSDGTNMTTGGATVVVTITGTNASSPTVTDNSDGTYTASDTPATAGSDSVAITLGGVAISGSPYSSTVSAAPSGSAYYFMRRRRR